MVPHEAVQSPQLAIIHLRCGTFCFVVQSVRVAHGGGGSQQTRQATKINALQSFRSTYTKACRDYCLLKAEKWAREVEEKQQHHHHDHKYIITYCSPSCMPFTRLFHTAVFYSNEVNWAIISTPYSRTSGTFTKTATDIWRATVWATRACRLTQAWRNTSCLPTRTNSRQRFPQMRQLRRVLCATYVNPSYRRVRWPRTAGGRHMRVRETKSKPSVDACQPCALFDSIKVHSKG